LLAVKAAIIDVGHWSDDPKRPSGEEGDGEREAYSSCDEIFWPDLACVGIAALSNSAEAVDNEDQPPAATG
jgi:hypothetical protein